jgi:GNAT superfamily N-acetyltransferase
MNTTTPQITLRAAQPEDAEAIATLYLSSRKTHVASVPLAHPDDAVRGWIAQHLLPAGGVRVAVRDGRVLGFSGSSVAAEDAHGAKIAWIDQLYVAPDAVGQGIGHALLTAALRGLPRPVRLYTFAANTGARRFYERHGFVAIEFGDGSGNEERCPDVLYELR